MMIAENSAIGPDDCRHSAIQTTFRMGIRASRNPNWRPQSHIAPRNLQGLRVAAAEGMSARLATPGVRCAGTIPSQHQIGKQFLTQRGSIARKLHDRELVQKPAFRPSSTQQDSSASV